MGISFFLRPILAHSHTCTCTCCSCLYKLVICFITLVHLYDIFMIILPHLFMNAYGLYLFSSSHEEINISKNGNKMWIQCEYEVTGSYLIFNCENRVCFCRIRCELITWKWDWLGLRCVCVCVWLNWDFATEYLILQYVKWMFGGVLNVCERVHNMAWNIHIMDSAPYA